jgi:hypothetical protein
MMVRKGLEEGRKVMEEMEESGRSSTKRSERSRK